jgi:hypothetical protein
MVYFLDRRILYLWHYLGLSDSFVVTFSLNIGALALVLFTVSFLGWWASSRPALKIV